MRADAYAQTLTRWAYALGLRADAYALGLRAGAYAMARMNQCIVLAPRAYAYDVLRLRLGQFGTSPSRSSGAVPHHLHMFQTHDAQPLGTVYRCVFEARAVRALHHRAFLIFGIVHRCAIEARVTTAPSPQIHRVRQPPDASVGGFIRCGSPRSIARRIHRVRQAPRASVGGFIGCPPVGGFVGSAGRLRG